MAIKIYDDYFCNTIGFLTNKEEKQKINLDRNKVAVEYSDIGIVVLKPVIDRIDFSFSSSKDLMKQSDPQGNFKKYMKNVIKSLNEDVLTKSDGMAPLTKIPFKRAPFKHYKTRAIFQPPGKSDQVIVLFNPYDPVKHAFMRIDMNPNRISFEGMKAFRKWLAEQFTTSLGPINYDDLLALATIHRIDFAVDILGARPSDLKVKAMANKQPVPKKSQSYQSDTGRVETIYPDLKKAKSNSNYVYDRRLKQIQTGHDPDFGDFLHSRYECRVGKTVFSKLVKQNNRCSRISVDALDLGKFQKKNHSQKLFIRLAIARNLKKALAVIPPKLQNSYELTYQSVMKKIWDADVIWSGLYDGVVGSGLFSKYPPKP